MLDQGQNSSAVHPTLVMARKPGWREFVRIVDCVILALAVISLLSAIARLHSGTLRNSAPAFDGEQQTHHAQPLVRSQAPQPALPHS
jgi:preprotein translocase subunit Sss1